MGDFTPYIFIIVFAVAIFIDIWGHYKRGLYRKRFDRIFLAVLFVLLGISVIAAFAVRHISGPDDEPGRYVAFQYLFENDPDSALYIVSEDGDMSDESKDLIRIMSEAVAGDKEDLYFDSRDFLNEKGHDAGQTHIVEELSRIAENALDGRNISSANVTDLVRSAYNNMQIQETDDLKELFSTDKSIRSGASDSIDKNEITRLISVFEEHDLVKKIAVSYYLTQEDFESAEDISRDLIGRNDSEADYVMYVDVMAQQVYSSETETLAETDDPEVSPLVDSAIDSYETAMSTNGNDIDSIERNVEKAEEHYSEARGVYYQRLINYLELKKNQGYDIDGLIALEMVKLRVLKEDYTTAASGMDALLDRIERLDTSSPIREDLIAVREVRDLLKAEGLGPGSGEFMRLCNAVSDLLNNASCMIFTYGEDNINGRAYKVIASMIYSGLPGLTITDTDTSKYPRTEIDFALNQRKRNMIGGPGEYYADDFTFTDQGETVNDCKLNAYNGYSGRSVVFVLDMQNHELSEEDTNELRSALYTFTGDNRVADKYALVNSSSFIQTDLTDNDLEVRYAIRNINTQYAVSAYTCLNTAMDLLERTGDEDDRAIIYITDGSTLSEEELINTANRASSGNIRIYGIKVGSGEDGNTAALCRASGGLDTIVPYYEQLCIFAKRLSEFMNYRYTAMFTAEADASNTSGRIFEITLNESGVSDSVEYAGGGS